MENMKKKDAKVKQYGKLLNSLYPFTNAKTCMEAAPTVSNCMQKLAILTRRCDTSTLPLCIRQLIFTVFIRSMHLSRIVSPCVTLEDQ